MSRLRHLPFYLCVVGSDAPSEFLPRVQSFRLSDRVQFFPENTEILPFYSAADIYAAPSLEDSFNLPVLEAMACGLPIVTTAVGGIPEVVKHGVNGFLVPPENPQSLAEAIELLLARPETAQRMRCVNRETAVSSYSMKGTAEQYAGLYDRIMSAAR